jgi:type I restriction enzyme S subunit
MGQSPAGETCNASGDGLPLLNGPTEFGSHHPTPVQYTTDARRRARPGDVLFCVRGSTTGRMNWADREYAIGRGIAAIRHKRGQDFQHFLRALIDCQLPELLAQATGSTFPNVSGDQLAAIRCDVLDEGEQRSIASVLGSLDDKIELNRRMNETLEALAQSLFKSWFVDATHSALPKGWRETVLSECCENIFSGGTPSTQSADYWGGDIPWLSSGETRSRFIIDTEKTITPLGVENSSTRPARAGSTVIASAGQGHTRGQTSFLTFDSYINQSVVVLVADKNLSSDLFMFFDLARRYEQFRQMSDSQSSRGSLTTKLLAEMTVVVPPRELISKFDNVVAPMTTKIVANLQESRTLAALRDALLPKLLSGELRVPAAAKLMEACA